MSQLPIPDGYLLLCFREPWVDSLDGYGRKLRIQMDKLRGWDRRDDFLMVWYDDERKSSAMYPYEALQSIQVVPNSEAYTKLLTRYQRQHDHNWVEEEPPPPVANFLAGLGLPVVQEEEDQPRETHAHCCTNKLGEEGCEATKHNGLIYYADGSIE